MIKKIIEDLEPNIEIEDPVDDIVEEEYDDDYEYDNVSLKIVIPNSESVDIEEIVETVKDKVDDQYEVIDYSFEVIYAIYTYVMMEMKVQIQEQSDTDFIDDILNFASDDENEWDVREIDHSTSLEENILDTAKDAASTIMSKTPGKEAAEVVNNESANITDLCPVCHKDPCECSPEDNTDEDGLYDDKEDDIVEENFDDDDYESDFDDGTVTAGDTFDYEGIEYEWIQQYGDVSHLDFDSWAIWEACPTDMDEDDPECKFFIVDVDTGFIDWECDTLEEAKEFLQSKVDDYELDEDLEADVKKCNDEFIDKGMSQIKRGIDKIPTEATNPGAIPNHPCKHKRCKDIDECDEDLEVDLDEDFDNHLEIEPKDIIVHKKSGNKYKVLKPLNGRVQVLNTKDNIVSHISNDYLTTDNFYILDDLDEDFSVVHEEVPENGDSNAQEVNTQLASFYDQLNDMGKFFVGSENKDIVQSIKDLQAKLKDLKV